MQNFQSHSNAYERTRFNRDITSAALKATHLQSQPGDRFFHKFNTFNEVQPEAVSGTVDAVVETLAIPEEKEKFLNDLSENTWDRIFITSTDQNCFIEKNPSQLTIDLPSIISYIKTIDVNEIILPKFIYNITSQNNILYLSEIHDNISYPLIFQLVIPPGTYTPQQLIDTLNNIVSFAIPIQNLYSVAGYTVPVHTVLLNQPVFTFDEISNKMWMRITPATAGSITYVLCTPAIIKELVTNRIDEQSINVRINQTMTLPDTTTYTVDIITLTTVSFSNICDNGFFDLTFLGKNGTLKSYSHMSNFICSTNNSLIATNSNVDTRTITFYVNSLTSDAWPFYPRTDEHIQSASIVNGACCKNISNQLGFNKSGPTSTSVKIINYADGGAGIGHFVTNWPHGLNQSVGTVPSPALIVNGTTLGNYDETANTPTDSSVRLITLTGLSVTYDLAGTIIESGYIVCNNIYIGGSTVSLTNPKDIFLKIKLDQTNEVGNIQPTAVIFNTFVAKIHYNYENVSTPYLDYVKTIGSHITEMLYPKCKTIQFSLHEIDGSLIEMKATDAWSCTITIGSAAGSLYH